MLALGWVYIYVVAQVCQPYMGPIAPLCWPRLALCLSTLYGPHLPLMLAHVGPMVAYVILFWPSLPLMLPHVGPMIAYVGPM